MPALGESVTEGTVTRWLKQEGEQVEVDEPLLEVSTDKVDTEIPSPVAGVLQEILVAEDETVEVGAELAVIGDGAGRRPAARRRRTAAGAAEAQPRTEPAADQVQAESTVPTAGRRRAAGAALVAPRPRQPAERPQPARAAGRRRRSACTLPALGESVTEGTVTRWLKQVGDTVEVDEPLLEVSTDKVDTEIPSPVAGVAPQILVGEDETVEVGAELAVDRPARAGSAPAGAAAAGSSRRRSSRPRAARSRPPAPPPPPRRPRRRHPRRRTPAARPGAAPQPGRRRRRRSSPPRPAAPPQPARPPRRPRRRARAGGSDAAYVTPLVRKLAAEHGVDLATVTGTGVGGRIRKQDVLDAAKAAAGRRGRGAPRRAGPGALRPPPRAGRRRRPPLRGTTEKMSRLRKVIAQRMVESLQVSAQLTTVVEVDVTKIARLRDQAKARLRGARGRQAVVPAVLRLAAVEALKAHPEVNASIDGRRHDHLPRRRAPRHRRRHRARPAGAGDPATPATSTSPASPARSPTWPSAPATTRSRRTSSPAARSR